LACLQTFGYRFGALILLFRNKFAPGANVGRLKVADVVRDTGLSRRAVDAPYQGAAVRVDLKTIDTLFLYLEVGIEELFEVT